MSPPGLPPPVPATAAAGAGGVRRAPLVLVAFSGRTELRWLRLLRPGFRHCFALMETAGGWLLYDPMAHATGLTLLPPQPAGALFDRLLAEGHVVVPVCPRAAPKRMAPWAPFTCVEAVKRLLGLHSRRVLTPWQLFQKILCEEKMLDTGTKQE